MRRLFTALVITAVSLFNTPHADAREQIRAVGSSTVYPFVTAAAEAFGKETDFKTPIIESTGTGGGFKLFCAGVGESHPDLSNASRAIKSSERDMCAKNGVADIIEIKLGYDGIVLANTREAPTLSLTKKQLFLALAREVPQNGALVENPYQKWNEIDASLPDSNIEIYGPPPTSGTRDAFVELVMEKACEEFPEFAKRHPDKKERKKACHLIREDGRFIETGENDNLIIQKLVSNPTALGLFGFSFLDQNADKVRGSTINGAEPSFENIADGSYGVSRPLYVYAKSAHINTIPGMGPFLKELVSDKAAGDEGYLSLKGLVPLGAEERAKITEHVRSIMK